MAEKFTKVDYTENDIPDDPSRIMKGTGGSVSDFKFNKIGTGSKVPYESAKKGYGVFAATDPDRTNKNSHDSRFRLDELMRGPLSIEDEELRAIEKRVTDQVNQERENAKIQGLEEGRKIGEEKAYKDASLKLQEEGKVRLEQFSKLIEDIEKAKARIYAENEEFLIHMIYDISKMVLLTELKADKEYLQRLCKSIIEKLGVKDNISIKINPKDMEGLTHLDATLKKSFGSLSNLKIEESEQVRLGGCKVETEWNAIDATIETQLKSIFQSLTGKSADDTSNENTQTEGDSGSGQLENG